MLEVVETCIAGVPYVSYDEANMQARGLSNMVAYWERMPEVNLYHGSILTKNGELCTIDKDLDHAMLATIDGTIASNVMTLNPIFSCHASRNLKKLSLLKPSKMRKTPAYTLLADLSKAFERVNPHWILELLRIRCAPRWLITSPMYPVWVERSPLLIQNLFYG